MRFLTLLFWPIRIVIRWVRQFMRRHDSAAGQRRRQAQRYATVLLVELARLGFESRVTVKKGKAKRKRVRYVHLLIAGATGGGKTTLYHSIISTLISRNTTDTLELWLVDMKRTEFALYRGLLGKRDQPGIVRHIAVDPEAAINLLGQAYKEIVQRNQFFEKSGVTSIMDLERSTERARAAGLHGESTRPAHRL